MTRLIRTIVATLVGSIALASVAAPASAQFYYESRPQRFQDDEPYAYPRQRGYQQPQGYYQQPQGYGRQSQGYYQQDQGNYQQRRGYGQPQYFDKQAAKNYWRAQKEAQKNAIKRGYYQ